ncbi:hypothetical protein N499_0632B, partial [Wolbachia pipientis wVitA]
IPVSGHWDDTEGATRMTNPVIPGRDAGFHPRRQCLTLE